MPFRFPVTSWEDASDATEQSTVQYLVRVKRAGINTIYDKNANGVNTREDVEKLRYVRSCSTLNINRRQHQRYVSRIKINRILRQGIDFLASWPQSIRPNKPTEAARMGIVSRHHRPSPKLKTLWGLLKPRISESFKPCVKPPAPLALPFVGFGIFGAGRSPSVCGFLRNCGCC